MDSLRCDFCSAVDPRHAYPCKTFEWLLSRSLEEWLACDTCHGIIEAGDKEALARRAAENILRGNPGMRSDAAGVLDMVRELHGLFYANRIAPENVSMGVVS